MDNKKKLIIAISALIVIIIVIILLVIKLVSINNSKNNEIENMNAEIGGNTAEENIIEGNNIVEDNNEEEQLSNNEEQYNEVENDIQTTPIADPEQEVDKQTIQKQESDQEKAMNIAKKDWGEDSTVYFSFEGVNNGKYTVAVREMDTTHTVRYYYINIATGTFDIEE